ncbi:hypothetical protein [Paenibacillus qinlingensis]|uniref:hypothetical protein n=1 Tax=Paenibacillus qinlingensis TaxID=1837343 RepID=UPI001565686B|nr:hypothetical protein [Paenibacillus qinlingensis]NQX60250.1 hypothetical protein [Paenibacillus qinlingensis]
MMLSVRKTWHAAAAFVFAFTLLFANIIHLESFVDWSGDAGDIWKTITTYYDSYTYQSYVLYKGYQAVFPYVWLYELSRYLNINEFIPIKVYYSLLFAYSVAIGMPYIVSKLCKVKINLVMRFIFIAIAFTIWQPSGALRQLMIDLPSFTYFVLGTSVIFLIQDIPFTKKYKLAYFILAGLSCGLASGGSGQYGVAAILLFIYACIIIFKKDFSKIISRESSKFLVVPITCIVLLTVGLGVVKFVEVQFQNVVIERIYPGKVGLATSKQWAQYALSAKLLGMTMGPDLTVIPDNRGTAIIKEKDGDKANERIELLPKGGGVYSNSEYIKLIVKHPVDFISRWCNRLLIAISFDGLDPSVSMLTLGATLVYICFRSIYKNCKTLSSFFTPNSLIVLAFVFTILSISVAHIEKRYALSIQALIMGVGLLNGDIVNLLRNGVRSIKQIIDEKSLQIIWHGSLSYSLVIYFVFLILYITHFASIFELLGPISGILFKP